LYDSVSHGVNRLPNVETGRLASSPSVAST
jgi:hypothetical protein